MITLNLPLAWSGGGGFTATGRALGLEMCPSSHAHDRLAAHSDTYQSNILPINNEWVYVAPSPRSITPFGGFYAPLAETERLEGARDTSQSNANCESGLPDHLIPTRRPGTDCINSPACHYQEPSQQLAPDFQGKEVAPFRYDDGPLVQTKWVANGFTVSSRRLPGKVKHYITQPNDLYGSPWESNGRHRAQCAVTMTESQTWKWRGRPIQTRMDYAHRPKLETRPPQHNAKLEESSHPECDAFASLDRPRHRLDQSIAATSNIMDEIQEASRDMFEQRIMVSDEKVARVVENKNEAATESIHSAARALSHQTQQHQALVDRLALVAQQTSTDRKEETENLQKATAKLQRQVSDLATHMDVLREALPVSAGIAACQRKQPVSIRYYEAPAPAWRPTSADYS